MVKDNSIYAVLLTVPFLSITDTQVGKKDFITEQSSFQVSGESFLFSMTIGEKEERTYVVSKRVYDSIIKCN